MPRPRLASRESLPGEMKGKQSSWQGVRGGMAGVQSWPEQTVRSGGDTSDNLPSIAAFLPENSSESLDGFLMLSGLHFISVTLRTNSVEDGLRSCSLRQESQLGSCSVSPDENC